MHTSQMYGESSADESPSELEERSTAPEPPTRDDDADETGEEEVDDGDLLRRLPSPILAA